jgi:hypothetical protein
MTYLLLCDAMFWRIGYLVLYLRLFKGSLFFRLRVFALLLSGLYSIFFFMPEKIGRCKLFTELCCYRILCFFLSGQVINYSQRS